MPKVGIIVLVYNEEGYLIRCLDSLVNQTFQDIEIIAVNDDSTNHSGGLLQIYQKSIKKKLRF